jgi:hypothetical protein
MLALDKPNTLIIPYDCNKRRLFFPFRYKQDGRPDDIYDSRNNFDTRHESTYDFIHQFRNIPIML